MDVFDQSSELYLAFLRENRHEFEVDIPFVTEIMGIIGSGVSQIIRNPSARLTLNTDGISISGLDLGFSYTRTTFHEEDKNSPGYLDIREDAGSAILKSNPVRIPIPGVSAPPNPIFDFGGYLRFLGKFGGSYEYVTKKLFFEEEYTPVTKSLQGFGGLDLDAGVDFRLKEPYDSYVQVVLDVFLSYPLELKLKYEWYLDGSEEHPKISREFNHGPASININIILSANSETLNIDWDIINASYNYPLTDKVFNRCCLYWGDPPTTCNSCD